MNSHLNFSIKLRLVNRHPTPFRSCDYVIKHLRKNINNKQDNKQDQNSLYSTPPQVD